MNPSPRAIERAVEALKATPGTFQRLIEGYAQIAHPELFRRLTPGGRRSDDVTRKGLPDATAELEDGTTALLEATHSESWERHLKEDVQNAEALASSSIGSFLFAAWAGLPVPEELDPYRRRLLTLGIPKDRLFFLFRDQLVTELSRPLFARLWADPLDLPVSCLPFDVVDKVPRLFGPEDRPDAFAPRRSEYQAGTVYRPRVADVVEERLGQAGWALVRGRGAAGKTTLALCIAFGSNYQGRPVYYLDLADSEGDEAEQADAIEAMATRGDAGVLYIIDNVHLAPAAASRLFEAWQELAGSGSRLLLLGRLITLEPDVRGRAHPLEILDSEALELAIDGEALVGVSQRIVARFAGDYGLPTPPKSVTESWLRLFGGDLIAFSSAITLRARNLLRGDWELKPEDSKRYIEKEYLQNLSPTQREAVTRLAVFATLELALTENLGGVALSEKLLEKGWIVRSEHGKNRHVRYRLVHPGIAELIIASLKQVDRLGYLCMLATDDSFAGVVIATRLMLRKDDSEAKAVLSSIAASPQWFSTSFEPKYLPSTVKMFEKYKVLTVGEIDNRLSQHGEFFATALKTNLGYLVFFLRFAKGELPGAYQFMVETLSNEKNRKTLAETALRSDLAGLCSLLSFARSELPGVYQFLVESLSEEKNRGILIVTALRTPLHFLIYFFSFLRNNLPGLHKLLVTALGEEKAQEVFAENVLRSPLAELGAFLKFAREELGGVYKFLVQTLSDEKNQGILAETALRTPLHFLSYFLGFSKNNLSGLYKLITLALSEEKNQEVFVENALRNPLLDLSAFLSFTRGELPLLHRSLAHALSDEKNKESLAATALRTPLGGLSSFLGFARGELPEVYKFLVQALADKKNQEILAETALRTPLGGLSSFLSFARGELPGVYKFLLHTLADEKNQGILAEAAVRSDLGSLSFFLSFTRGELPGVYKFLIHTLGDEKNQEILAETAAKSDLGGLGFFLSFTRGELPGVYKFLIHTLADEKNQEGLAETALRAQLGALGSFLNIAKDELPEINKLLEAILEDEPNQRSLIDTALKTPLEQLQAFLGAASDRLPGVYQAIGEALGDEKNQKVFMETILASPLEHLGSFLSFARDTLPGVYRLIVAALAEEKNQEILADIALKTPLEHLSSFLGFARCNLDSIFDILIKVLSEDRGAKLLADRVIRTSLNHISGIFKVDEIASTVIKYIDAEQWQEMCLRYGVEGVEALPSIARQLIRYRRPDLAVAPARGAVLTADIMEWHRPGVTASALSHAIRLAGDLEPDDLDRFLDRIATPSWLKSSYLFLYPGLLAGTLYSLWFLLDDRRLKRFQTPALLGVVEQKANPWSAGQSTTAAHLVSLIGVGALFGVSPSLAALVWASDTVLRSAWVERTPNEENPVLGPLQVQFWLGLRVIAAHRKKPLRLSKAEGDLVLQLWREAEPENAKLQRLNRWMIGWLERCAAAGWRLLPDETPLV
ncbi:MAG TPA: hypothetical protein VLV54_17445 [Thermoanaerobaculia bacterium]|nr:hypothetical protein [Thermoanaerobaculia bacterium]